MSKRKLQQLVDKGAVDGWNDPRFPTIQGCLRRGVTVQCLKDFVVSQGFSKRLVDMEWDKFWSVNNKIIDANAERHMV
jgi:glutamyl/glutaminyl-tRNA synthetase